MKSSCIPARFLLAITMFALASLAPAQSSPAPAGPYKIVQKTQLMGTGRIDYVTADSVNRRLYVPRGNSVLTFDLD